MYSITCDNRQGMRMTFDTKGFNPFVLARVEGIFKAENNVFTKDNTMSDGATYQGTVAKKRNIVLTLMDKPNNEYNQGNRDVLYTLFSERSKGQLTYEEDGSERVIDYYVEKVYRPKPTSRLIVVSLICTNPFFYDKDFFTLMLANFVGDFTFPHRFKAEGETIGHREPTRIATIYNDVAVGDLGMVITLEAISDVLNPKIVRVEDNSVLQIGSEDYPFAMVANDVVMITTSTNDKHVYLIRNGVRREINEYLTETSEFVQIKRGRNTFGYDAQEGVEHLILTIQYKKQYEGA